MSLRSNGLRERFPRRAKKFQPFAYNLVKPLQLEMGVVVSFSEIFNRPATIEGAREILARYKREAVLLVLAKLGTALRI